MFETPKAEFFKRIAYFCTYRLTLRITHFFCLITQNNMEESLQVKKMCRFAVVFQLSIYCMDIVLL